MRTSLRSLSIVGCCALVGLALASRATTADIQVWEKPIAPGLTYRMEVESDPMRLIHILRFNPASVAVSAKSALAGGTVYEPGATKGRTTVGEMVKQNNGIAGINADFFPYTGDPLGLMVQNGKLLSLPWPKRAVFAWGPNTAQVGFPKFIGTVTPDKGDPISIEGLNEEAPDNKVTLNGPEAGISISKSPCVTLTLKLESKELPPSTITSGVVTAKSNDATSVPIEPGQYTLVGRGTRANDLAKIKVGTRVFIKFQTTGFDWERIEHAVGGGPVLIKDGKMSIDADEEGFNFDFFGKRHPRTAVGRTKDGDLIFVAIDGRQTMSVGATLAETAEIMMRLGCREAMNLDGGGSTALSILGITVNRPSEKSGERPVANGIVFTGPRVTDDGVKMSLKVPGTLKVDGTATFEVLDDKKQPIPNVEILWAMQGAGWIDQGGLARGAIEGEATVSAFVRGRVLTAKVKIVK